MKLAWSSLLVIAAVTILSSLIPSKDSLDGSIVWSKSHGHAVEAKGMSDESTYGDYHKSAEEFRKRIADQVKDAMNGARSLPDGKKSPSNDDLYYFFSIHDYNHDAHLDGHELRVSFSEFEASKDRARGNQPDDQGKYARDRLTLREVEAMIDKALEEDDVDNDGMISWSEYLTSQKKHHQF